MAEAGPRACQTLLGSCAYVCFLSAPLPEAHTRLGTSTACFLARILLLNCLVLLHGSKPQASLLIFGSFSTHS